MKNSADLKVELYVQKKENHHGNSHMWIELVSVCMMPKILGCTYVDNNATLTLLKSCC